MGDRLLLIETPEFETTPEKMLDVLTRIVADRGLGMVFFRDYFLMDVELLGGGGRKAIEHEMTQARPEAPAADRWRRSAPTTGPGRPTRRRAQALLRLKRSWSRTSGSTGTDMSGGDFMSKQPLQRLIDCAASEPESLKKGVGNRQDTVYKNQRSAAPFWSIKKEIFLIANADKVLCCRTLAIPDSERPLSPLHIVHLLPEVRYLHWERCSLAAPRKSVRRVVDIKRAFSLNIFW